MPLANAPSSEFPLNWMVLLPVVMGGLAVWYLLPTPRRRTAVYGVLGGIVALAGFGIFLFHGLGQEAAGSVETILFSLFSTLALIFAVLMISQRNPARAAISFAVVILNVCGLFLLLAAPFLMAATLIIYAGAIIVTFLFVIMLSHQYSPSDADDRSREPMLSAAVGFVLLGTLLVVLQRVNDTRDIDEVIDRADRFSRPEVLDANFAEGRFDGFKEELKKLEVDADRALRRLGYPKKEGTGERIVATHTSSGLKQRVAKVDDAASKLYSAADWAPRNPPSPITDVWLKDIADSKNNVRLKLDDIRDGLSAIKAAREGGGSDYEDITLSPYPQAQRVNLGNPDLPESRGNRLPAANVAALGRTLFTDHLLAIELAGTLLLVATIGAIAIAGTRPERKAR